ncbi:hypothetical protein [Polluticaenibacter yanchengensis]|uniref:Uncharacterized protein n=1 Tax=Polluticaenibacter yanchengensis TaxID=3014562 RepID=A0ABT4UIK8_9BACT|nr:hypothetical protein [Chitinophagaceae bacterium LY-5]
MTNTITVIKEFSKQLQDLGVDYIICAVELTDGNTQRTITSVSADKNTVQNLRHETVDSIEEMRIKKTLFDVCEKDY